MGSGEGEWDVQTKKKHTNIGLDGEITHGPNNTGRDPKDGGDSGGGGQADYDWVPIVGGVLLFAAGVAIVWTGVGTAPGAAMKEAVSLWSGQQHERR